MQKLSMSPHPNPPWQRIYLLGYPLGHSISPAMQNAALRARGLRTVRYEKLPVPPDKLETTIATLRAEECLGANVTVPHKQEILPFLDELSELAREIGAVNTILKRVDANGVHRLVGENTDAYGFMQALRVRGIHPQNARAAIIGAGGAAAAAAYALAQEGAREIILLNRTLSRAVALADRLGARFPRLELAINDWEALPRMHFIINATSIGMAPHADESPLPPGATLPRGAIVYDLVYNPPETRFLREARRVGARVIGGLEMLIYQGARAFELWTGQDAPVEVMRKSATRALREMIRKG